MSLLVFTGNIGMELHALLPLLAPHVLLGNIGTLHQVEQDTAYLTLLVALLVHLDNLGTLRQAVAPDTVKVLLLIQAILPLLVPKVAEHGILQLTTAKCRQHTLRLPRNILRLHTLPLRLTPHLHRQCCYAINQAEIGLAPPATWQRIYLTKKPITVITRINPAHC